MPYVCDSSTYIYIHVYMPQSEMSVSQEDRGEELELSPYDFSFMDFGNQDLVEQLHLMIGLEFNKRW